VIGRRVSYNSNDEALRRKSLRYFRNANLPIALTLYLQGTFKTPPDNWKGSRRFRLIKGPDAIAQ